MSVLLFREIPNSADTDSEYGYSEQIGEFPDLESAKAEAERRLAAGEKGFSINDAAVSGEGNEAGHDLLWADPETMERIQRQAAIGNPCPKAAR